MNLLIVMPSGQLSGGAEEALLQYATCCSEAGTPVSVAVLEDGPVLQALEDRGARVTLVNAGQMRQVHLWLKTVKKLKALAQQQKVDLLLSWMTKAHLYASPAARAARLPAVYFQHGLPDNGFIDRACRILPATGAVGCSSFVAREQGAKVRHPVLPVPMAADLKRFEMVRALSVAAMKQELGFDAARPLIGMVGRLQHWKGMHVFAQAFAQLKRLRPEVQGVIVGGAWEHELEYETSLRGLLRELKIEDSLRMVGLQRNVPHWMQAMDVFVHASHREPFGIVIVEAMSLGKPVIATVPGGPAEIIEAGVSGQLVNWDKPEELTRALDRFLTEQPFAASCGNHAFERAQQFSSQIFTDNLNKALHSLCNASPTLQ